MCLLKSIDAGGRKAMDGAMQGRKRSGKIKRKRVAHRRECELLTHPEADLQISARFLPERRSLESSKSANKQRLCAPAGRLC